MVNRQPLPLAGVGSGRVGGGAEEGVEVIDGVGEGVLCDVGGGGGGGEGVQGVVEGGEERVRGGDVCNVGTHICVCLMLWVMAHGYANW